MKVGTVTILALSVAMGLIVGRTQSNALRAAAPMAASQADQGPGMRVTFQSCGYQAVGLNVSCKNLNTGGSNAQLLEAFDTSASSCAAKLATACNGVGYRAEQSGDSTVIYGTGISVTAVGPVFTKQDF